MHFSGSNPLKQKKTRITYIFILPAVSIFAFLTVSVLFDNRILRRRRPPFNEIPNLALAALSLIVITINRLHSGRGVFGQDDFGTFAQEHIHEISYMLIIFRPYALKLSQRLLKISCGYVIHDLILYK